MMNRLALLTSTLFISMHMCSPSVVKAQQIAPAKTVCLDCHAPQPGRGGRPVKEWQESIHAVNGISCHDCHGGDARDAVNAMSPARGFLGVPKEKAIPVFCGRCHVGIKKEFLVSAHGRALGRGGPTCVTCHGSHGITKVTLDLINESSCSRCHPYQRAAAIKQAMQETEQLLVGIERDLQRQKGEGVDTDADENRLFAVKNRYHRLFHNVDTSRVKRESAELQGELAKLQKTLAATNEQRERRKTAGAIALGGLLVLALVLYLLGRTVDSSST
jgi:hypothetical protein